MPATISVKQSPRVSITGTASKQAQAECVCLCVCAVKGCFSGECLADWPVGGDNGTHVITFALAEDGVSAGGHQPAFRLHTLGLYLIHDSYFQDLFRYFKKSITTT